MIIHVLLMFKNKYTDKKEKEKIIDTIEYLTKKPFVCQEEHDAILYSHSMLEDDTKTEYVSAPLTNQNNRNINSTRTDHMSAINPTKHTGRRCKKGASKRSPSY